MKNREGPTHEGIPHRWDKKNFKIESM